MRLHTFFFKYIYKWSGIFIPFAILAAQQYHALYQRKQTPALIRWIFVTHTWRNLIRSLGYFSCHIIYRIGLFYFGYCHRAKIWWWSHLKTQRAKLHYLNFFIYHCANILGICYLVLHPHCGKPKYFQGKDNDTVWGFSEYRLLVS